MFLYPEHRIMLLEPHTYLYIKSLVSIALKRIESILHIFALPRFVSLLIDHLRHKIGVEVINEIETAGHIDHRTDIAVTIHKMERRYTALL